MVRIPTVREVRRRLRGSAWPAVQTAASAVAAWYAAAWIVGDPQPTFAAIAAVICIGATYGERRGRAFQLTGGVVIGIFVADLLVRAIGSGPPQLGLMVLGAMLVAIALGGRPMIVTEAGVSAALLAALPPAGPNLAFARPVEALVGGGIALAISSLAFPPDPRLHVARATDALLAEVASTLEALAVALERAQPSAAATALDRARGLEEPMRGVDETLATGRETALLSPLRRPAGAELARYGAAASHLERAVRNTRGLARHVSRFARTEPGAAGELPAAMRELKVAVWELAGELDDPGRPSELREHVGRAIALAEGAFERDRALGLAEIAASVRTMAVDLVRAADAATPGRPELAETPTEELLVELPEDSLRAGG